MTRFNIRKASMVAILILSLIVIIGVVFTRAFFQSKVEGLNEKEFSALVEKLNPNENQKLLMEALYDQASALRYFLNSIYILALTFNGSIVLISAFEVYRRKVEGSIRKSDSHY